MLKHGEPRAIYAVLLAYARFALMLVLPPLIIEYLRWSPDYLDYPILFVCMVFASLWTFGALVPFVALVLATALVFHYTPKIICKLIEYMKSEEVSNE